MSLTIDHTITDFNEWATEPSTVDDWLFVMFGIVPGASSRPTQPWGGVHPPSVAAAGWLNALFGFAR